MVRDPRAQLQVHPAGSVDEDPQNGEPPRPDQVGSQHLDVRLRLGEARLDLRLEIGRRVAWSGSWMVFRCSSTAPVYTGLLSKKKWAEAH